MCCILVLIVHLNVWLCHFQSINILINRMEQLGAVCVLVRLTHNWSVMSLSPIKGPCCFLASLLSTGLFQVLVSQWN